jgi:hypothetical protein
MSSGDLAGTIVFCTLFICLTAAFIVARRRS